MGGRCTAFSFTTATANVGRSGLCDVNRRDADAIAVRVNSLVSASVAGNPPDKATLEWLVDVGQELADKLAGAGLIGRRESATLAAFLDGYIASRGDAKPNTIRNLKNSRERLVAQFGPDRALHTIKPGDADDWRQAMVNAGLAEATISKAVKHAKQYFKLAQRKGLIRSNPFAELKAGGERNDARKQFIDRATVDKLIDSAPDVEWQLIIALSRYGGLRSPSETLALRWSDVDWAGQRVTIPSPKTERHGKAYRVVPLFPELRTVFGGRLRCCRARGRVIASPATAVPIAICERNCCGSSAGRPYSRGKGCSTICGRAGKRN